MKITKRQLKRIIKEEKAKVLKEWFSDEHDPETGERDQFEDPMEGVREELLNLAAREEGITLDEIQNLWGPMGFDLVDELTEEDLVWLDDQEAVVYATSGHQRSTGLDPAVRSYVGESKTKLNRRQLKRIIKEEKRKLVNETGGIGGGYRHPKTGESLLLMLNDVVDKLLDQGMDTFELAEELRGLADDVEGMAPMEYSR